MAKQATNLVEQLDLRVVYDDGREVDYRTAPIDHWRAEKLTGQSIVDAIRTFSGLSALAYGAALRAGDAYKARKAATDQAALYEAWLERVANVAVLQDDGEAGDDGPPGDVLEEEEGSSPG